MYRMRKVSIQGSITTVAGLCVPCYNGDNISATSAYLYYPQGVVVDAAGNLFIADTSNFRIRKVSTNGLIATVAGMGGAGYNGDNISATSAYLYYPYGVAVDLAGNLLIAASCNHRIRKVSTNGIITTVAGTGGTGYNGDGIPGTGASLTEPHGVAVDTAGNLFIADTYNNRIREVISSSNGSVLANGSLVLSNVT